MRAFPAASSGLTARANLRGFAAVLPSFARGLYLNESGNSRSEGALFPMANDEWLRPATLAGASDGSAWNRRPVVAAMYELRPLSIGEILDRSFTIFRSRFWLFAGLAAVSGAVQLVFHSIALLVGHLVRLRMGINAGVIANTAGIYIAAILFALASTVTLAATTWALAEIYLGRDASIAGSLRATIGRWYRYLLIGIWLGINVGGAMLVGVIPGIVIVAVGKGSAAAVGVGSVIMVLGMLAGLPVGIWLYLRNIMAIPVCVVEGSDIRASLKRSHLLSKGVKWRLIVLGLVIFALLMVVSALQLPFTIPVLTAPTQEHMLAQAGILFVNLLGHILVAPIGTIGLTLFYFDQRVRKEGFDLLVLMGEGSGAGAAPFAPMASPGSPMVSLGFAPPPGYGAPYLQQPSYPPLQLGVTQPMPPPGYGAYPPAPPAYRRPQDQPTLAYGGFPAAAAAPAPLQYPASQQPSSASQQPTEGAPPSDAAQR